MRKIQFAIIILIVLTPLRCTKDHNYKTLNKNYFRHYIEDFNQKDNELYIQHISNDSAFIFLSENIPLIEIPDKDIEETYYFRWWTFRKHIKHTEDGFIITEFLPKVPWSGKHNAINCPAGHQIYEGRWLRNSEYVSDYIDFWLNKSGDGIRQYGFWAADATLAFHKVHRNDSLLMNHLAPLVSNYEQWEKIRRDPTSILFWQEDNKEGMEVSASGQILNNGILIGGMPAIRDQL